MTATYSCSVFTGPSQKDFARFASIPPLIRFITGELVANCLLPSHAGNVTTSNLRVIMKLNVVLFIIAAINPLPIPASYAQAPLVTIVEDQPCCNENHDPVPVSGVTRSGAEIKLRITSNFACGVQPTSTEFSVQGGKGFLWVKGKSPSGWVAMCLCARHTTYLIRGLPQELRKLKTIYYLQDGHIYGSVRIR